MKEIRLCDNTEVRRAFSLLEEYCPNVIWYIECKLDYMSVETLKSMGIY